MTHTELRELIKWTTYKQFGMFVNRKESTITAYCAGTRKIPPMIAAKAKEYHSRFASFINDISKKREKNHE